jgi:hypothetical protein
MAMLLMLWSFVSERAGAKSAARPETRDAVEQS